MRTNTSRESLPAWENSRAAQTAERIARALCGAVAPGLFLGAAFTNAIHGFEAGSGPFGTPAAAFIIAALEAVFGAVLVGSWREKHPSSGTRGLLVLPAALLFVYGFLPGPKSALAICGILAGGYLTALPLRSGVWRFLAGGTFALSAFLLAGDPEGAALWQMVLFPLLFASTILWVKAHWLLRLAMIVLLPLSTVFFTNGMLARRPPVQLPQPRDVAPALPALLMANADSTRILFLSARSSLIPGVWLEMPFVDRVESIWPQGVILGRFGNPKFKPYEGLPGRVLPTLEPGFHLIYTDQLPRGGESARRGFVRKLWELLDPSGILVLPSENRLLLPASAQWAVLPGSDGGRIAASREAVSADPEVLDDRLQKLLAPFGDEPMIPAGIVPALYDTAGAPPKLPPPEGVPSPGTGDRSPWFYGVLVLALAGYGAIRLYFGRFGRNLHGFSLLENSAGFALILLAAYDSMSARELFTGVPASLAWGCLGLAIIAPALRARAAGVFAIVALLLPAVWLIPASIATAEPSWLAVTAVVALATGSIRAQLAGESGFPRSWSTTFDSAGWVVGGMLYTIFQLLPGDPLLPAILTAAVLRLAWPLKL